MNETVLYNVFIRNSKGCFSHLLGEVLQNLVDHTVFCAFFINAVAMRSTKKMYLHAC